MRSIFIDSVLMSSELYIYAVQMLVFNFCLRELEKKSKF